MSAYHAGKPVTDQDTAAPFSVKNARTLLIATPDPLLRRHLQTLLNAAQYNFLEAETGAAALRIIREVNPDLALVADALPDISGYAVCREVKALPMHYSPPIIMLLPQEDDETINRAYESGALDYVSLPPRPAALRQRVNILLKMREMRGMMTENEERYRIISSMITDYAYAYRVDAENRLVKDWSTQAFETITGYNPNELDGDGWSRLIHPDDLPVTRQRAQRLLAGQRDVTEFRIVTKDGRVRWLLDHGLPVWDDHQGRVVKIYGAAQDITERKQAEALMWQRTAELQQRNEELDAFAHTVAHDLKNPISSMMGFASLVLNYYDRMTEDKVREYLQLIMESGYKLKEIINSLLLLAGVNRMETVEIRPLDMGDVVYSAQARLTAMIDEHSAEIIMPPRWPKALGYAPWVEEIWANYLSNALKYGGTPPRIEFGAEPCDDGQVRFWIRDNGQGLSPEDQQRVFTPFTRLSQAKIEGHGLGLSVVQRIVERLDGAVGVESQVGAGSTFSFTLPRAP